MNDKIIFILDFDGVICDSAIETGMSGWKAASQIWHDMPAELPDQKLINQFRHVRPMLETGYEAILIIRLLYLGESVDNIMKDYTHKTQSVLSTSKQEIRQLKQLFGTTRDQWIEKDLADWISKNPLYSGVSEKLKRIETQGLWYITTTKQERFVQQILGSYQINLPENRLFGLEHNMSKEDVLLKLMHAHPNDRLVLVEDRLPTLISISKNPTLRTVKLLLAAWGYNTAEERQGLESGAIELLTLEHFLA